jgi:2-(1,2-epoxy-1,2-dihydrophenyl)acetyl-CoA isomerase
MAATLELEQRGGVSIITLNRPKSLNALNSEMALDLRDVLRQIAREDAVRCLIIRGAGEHFMAGGDIAFFQQSLTLSDAERERQVSDLVGIVHESVQLLRQMEQPVIAAVRGSVAGFGMSLMAACDLAIAAENAVFVQAYTQIGTTPDGGNTYHLPRTVGLKQAMAMTLLNEPIDAAQALAMGLINKVVAADALDSEALGMARRLTAGPVGAQARAKQLINHSFENNLQQQLEAEQASFTRSSLTADFAEGVTAFLEKRRPDFSGD